jgi:hypothetical protein
VTSGLKPILWAYIQGAKVAFKEFGEWKKLDLSSSVTAVPIILAA